MSISASLSNLLHCSCQSHPPSDATPNCWTKWCCCWDMLYIRGYFSNSKIPPSSHPSSQNFTFDPHPIFHFIPLLNQLPSSNALQTLLKSRHQIESLLFLLDSSRLLQLPYLESNTFAHNSPWRWKRHHHFLSRARLNFTKSKYGQFELLEGNFNFVHCVLYKWFHWLRKSNHICHFPLIYYLRYLAGLFAAPCSNFQSLEHDWIASTRLQWWEAMDESLPLFLSDYLSEFLI